MGEQVGLRLPHSIDLIGPLSGWGFGPYPPASLAVFEDFSLGNGDNYGLYWPIGREEHEPLVVETVHDEAGLVPAFSNLDRFLDFSAGLDEADYVGWPSVGDDPQAPHALYQAARTALKAHEFETAQLHLVESVKLLPEYAAAHSLLVELYRRAGAHDEACRAAVCAIRSPPSFGMHADVGRAWSWLSRQSQGPEDLSDDPIWSSRASLSSPPKGGAKANDTYSIISDAIDAYVGSSDVIAASTLMQTYAEYMVRETTAFQERYGFERSTYLQKQAELEDLLPSGRRTRI